MHTQTRVYQTFFVVVVVVWKNFVVVVVDPKIEYCQLGGNVVIWMKIKHFHLWSMIWRKTVLQFDNLEKSKVRKERKNERISNKKQFKAVQELLFTSKKNKTRNDDQTLWSNKKNFETNWFEAFWKIKFFRLLLLLLLFYTWIVSHFFLPYNRHKNIWIELWNNNKMTRMYDMMGQK